jgi:hypothetical protein
MICFAILAHDDEDVLRNQIDNVRKYNSGCHIVLYNGGTDPKFGKTLDIPSCPYSRPLKLPKLGRFLIDTMKWLTEEGASYDYLVNLDSDVLFIQHGFEEHLHQSMKNYDCMGLYMRKIDRDYPELWWYPAQTMWKEWGKWNLFFQTDYFVGTLNAMQVYRRSIVEQMLPTIDMCLLDRLLGQTSVFALEEILHATLAARCGGRFRSYYPSVGHYIQIDSAISKEELQAIHTKPFVYFVHPIKRQMDDPARQWIKNSMDIFS